MTPKKTGACTKCDKDVFEVKNEYANGKRRLGKPLDDAVRSTFLLMGGSRMDLTFCRECAEALEPAEYGWVWRRVMLSWITESGANHPGVKEQQDNAIVGLLGSKPWKELYA